MCGLDTSHLLRCQQAPYCEECQHTQIFEFLFMYMVLGASSAVL